MRNHRFAVENFVICLTFIAVALCLFSGCSCNRAQEANVASESQRKPDDENTPSQKNTVYEQSNYEQSKVDVKNDVHGPNAREDNLRAIETQASRREVEETKDPQHRIEQARKQAAEAANLLSQGKYANAFRSASNAKSLLRGAGSGYEIAPLEGELDGIISTSSRRLNLEFDGNSKRITIK